MAKTKKVDRYACGTVSMTVAITMSDPDWPDTTMEKQVEVRCHWSYDVPMVAVLASAKEMTIGLVIYTRIDDQWVWLPRTDRQVRPYIGRLSDLIDAAVMNSFAKRKVVVGHTSDPLPGFFTSRFD